MATKEDWIQAAVEKIHREYPGVLAKCNDQTPEPWLYAVLREACPFEGGVAYLPVRPTGNLGPDMVNALNEQNYWEACLLAVSKNDELYRENNELKRRLADSLTLLGESKREHAEVCSMDYSDTPCNCGATEWNARVDAALAGRKP